MTAFHVRFIYRVRRWIGSLHRPAKATVAGNRLGLAELTELFARLGCADPEGWARSQLEEGINQLGRYLFIKCAWAKAVPTDSTDWIDNILKNSPPDTALGAAWRRLCDSGADRSDLAMIVRDGQADIIFGLCYLLDGPDDMDPDIPLFGWNLFEVDASGGCVGPIKFVHESVLELDPERPCR